MKFRGPKLILNVILSRNISKLGNNCLAGIVIGALLIPPPFTANSRALDATPEQTLMGSSKLDQGFLNRRPHSFENKVLFVQALPGQNQDDDQQGAAIGNNNYPTETTPEVTTPEVTTPEVTTPEVTTPEVTVENDPEGEAGGFRDDTSSSFAGSVSEAETDAIVSEISKANKICKSLPAAYQADCVSQHLAEAAKIVRDPAYARVNANLRIASTRINVRSIPNLDRKAPPIKVGNKTIRAVKQTAVAKVNRTAKKVVEETATRIIRSAGNSQKKRNHFTRIAKAVDSTKLLLRSA